MFTPRPGTKQDPVRRWAQGDRAFFACGACHILAGVCLRDRALPGLYAERIRPGGPYPGNHVYVTDGTICFDYRGLVARDRLLDWFRASWRKRVTGWTCTVTRVDFDLLDTSALNARQMRGPDQYAQDPIPRARAFIAVKLPFSD